MKRRACWPNNLRNPGEKKGTKAPLEKNVLALREETGKLKKRGKKKDIRKNYRKTGSKEKKGGGELELQEKNWPEGKKARDQ